MPRTRTRASRVIFSFIALALVLVAAIATTLCQSATAWQPQDPLRFSLVDVAGPPELISGHAGACRVENIVVENTSATPIHLISMWVAETPGASARVSLPMAPAPARDGLSTTTGVIIVPPHSTIYATSTVPLECLTPESKTHEGTQMQSQSQTHAGNRSQVRMNFLWQSRTRNATSRALEWLYAHSPPILQAHVPGIPARLHHAPLQWAATITSGGATSTASRTNGATATP